jgi:hypothetical protein
VIIGALVTDESSPMSRFVSGPREPLAAFARYPTVNSSGGESVSTS